MTLSLAPRAKIDGVQGNAEQVRGDEPELRCAKADQANDHAVDGRQNPAFPTSTSYQNRGTDRKYAG